MSSPSESPTTRPDFIIRAKRGSLTETLVDVFTSLRRRSDSQSNQSSTGPSSPSFDIISEITLKDIKGAKHIGSGGFGAVYVYEHPTKGKVAMKQVCVSGLQGGDDLRRSALREGGTWSRLKHRHVLPFLGILETTKDLYLISPYVKNGSLSDYIILQPFVNRQRLLWEAAVAIAFLHKHGIVHGDIKGSNILVSDDVHALLCDFGLARSDTAATSIGLQGVGTIRFESPELLLEGGGKTFASDVWAFGMMVSEVLSGKVPFHQHTTSTAVIAAVVVRDERPPTIPSYSRSGTSHDLSWGVARECWLKDPSQRPSMKNVHQRLGAVLKSYIGTVTSLAFSPDGKTIVSGVSGDTIRAWDVESATGTGVPFEGRTDQVVCLVFSPDGATIAAGFRGGNLRLWNADHSGRRGKRMKGHNSMVRCLAFSPDGRTIASGSEDRTIRLWDVESRSQSWTLEGHIDAVWCLAFSPDGMTIISGSDCSLRLWDAKSGIQSGWFEGPAAAARCLALSPDGTTIVTSSWDSKPILWDVASRSQKGSLYHDYKSSVSCLAFSPDGKTIASGSSDRKVRLWDAASRRQGGGPLEGHTNQVKCLAFSPDGTTVASGSKDEIRLWDVDT